MPLAQFDEGGLIEPLQPGEVLRCLGCDATFGSEEDTGNWNVRNGTGQCPGCAWFPGFVRQDARPRTTVAERWGDAALSQGFVAVPNLLRRERAALGVDSFDIDLITEIEALSYREGYAWASHAHYARSLDISLSTVRKRLKVLEEKGLIEGERRWKANGSPNSTIYRLQGLREALAALSAEGPHSAPTDVEFVAGAQDAQREADEA